MKEILLANPLFSGRRLLDTRSIAELSLVADRCRAEGLRFGFAGAIELADIPRLGALGPDVIGFDTALRDVDDRFDPARLADIRDAMSDASPRPARKLPTQAQPDRIFVRDWTVPMRIGAYARERDRPQRVRFTVEAEVDRTAGGTRLADTVSYDLITDAISRLAAAHIDLVEDLADRLAALVLAEPRVSTLDITVEKLDVGPGSVGCRIFRRRGTV